MTPPASPFHDRVVPLRSRVPTAAVQGTLALDVQPRWAPPSPSAQVVAIGIRSTRPLQEWTHRFAQAAVEIVGGDRPVSQLLRWCSAEVYADLQRRAQLVARAGGHVPGAARVQPVRPQVRSVHVDLVASDVAEACVRVRYGRRSRALAARFERRHEAWICTALEWA